MSAPGEPHEKGNEGSSVSLMRFLFVLNSNKKDGEGGNDETKKDKVSEEWEVVSTRHAYAAVVHSILLGLCVVVIAKTSSETPPLGIVKAFDGWPVWDGDSTRSHDTRVTIFHMWKHCHRRNLSDAAKSQCDMDVTELDISLVMILFCTQLTTFVGHVVQYYLCSKESKTFKELSIRGIKIVFWIEYTFSASFIAVVTSYLSGNVDIKSLLLILSSQSTLMLVGLLIDILRYIKNSLVNNHDTVFREFLGTEILLACRNVYPVGFNGYGPLSTTEEGGAEIPRTINCCPALRSYTALMVFIFAVGFFNLGCQWGPGLLKVFDSIGTNMPDWIVGLYLTEIILYASFGFVQVYYTLWRSDQKYMLSEHNRHTLLSFLSKATLVLFFLMYFVNDPDKRRYGIGANTTLA